MTMTGSDRELLRSMLNDQRQAIARAIHGTTEEQARFVPCEGANSLIAIVNHLAWVEKYWFEVVYRGEPDPWPEDDPDIDFKVPDDQSVEATIALFANACRASNAIFDESDLDAVVPSERGDITMRWIALHMIEETARHAGHADVTRQLVDGRRDS